MGFEKWSRNKINLQKLNFVALLLLVILILFVVLIWCTRAPKMCINPECIRTATHILDTIDSSVDPCDNFYNFACGGFLKNAFPLGQPTTIHFLKELMKHKLKEIVVETADERSLWKTLVLERQFYRACMRDAAIEEDNDKTFLRLLDELVGGWPVLKGEKWNDSQFDWSKSVVKARKLGLFYQFYFRVEVYPGDNSTLNILSIQPPLEKDISTFYWQSQYLHLAHEIALKWGAANNLKAVDELKKTMDFAGQLDQIVKNYYNKTSLFKLDTNLTIPLKDLDHKLFKLNWVELLTDITGVQLKKDQLVVFEAEDYFTDLYYVLLMKAPKRTQANYMSWAVISKNMNYLSKKIRDRYKKITKTSNDRADNLNRSDFCFKASRELFKNVAESEYIRRNNPPIKREYVGDIIKNVKQELKIAIQSNTWMDAVTKHYAINYLGNITELVGGTGIVYNVSEFERAFGYNCLKITSDKVVNIKREVTINRVDHYYRQLITKSEVEFVDIPKLGISVYYSKYLKTLVLPTALLESQIFNENRPPYVNYGSLGTILGHAFTSGLMENSSIKNVSAKVTWWTNETRKNFEKITRCLVDEYAMYPEKLTGFNKNGSELEENLYDFSSVNLAYAAYQRWVGKNSHLESLPGIKYTPNQIFWIMASTHLCFDSKLAKKYDTMKTHSTHSVPSFRVIGSLRNSPYFARDFNCPVDSKMNPAKKCQIFT